MFREILQIAYGLAAWVSVVALVYLFPAMDPYCRAALQFAVLPLFVVMGRFLFRERT